MDPLLLPEPEPTPGDLARPLNAVELALAAWLDAKFKRSRSEKTRRSYTDSMTSFRAALAALNLDLDSDPRQVALVAQGWAHQRSPDANRAGPVAASTVNQRLAVISSFYRYAIRQGLLAGENPIGRAERRPVQGYAHVHALSPAEVQASLSAIDRTTPAGLRDYALLAVALNTGRRRAELASLRGQDVVIAGSKVTLTFWRAKGGKVMRDTLPQAVGRALVAWLHHRYGAQLGALPADAPIWVSLSPNNEGEPLTTWGIGHICKQRIGTAQVHTLRHTFARLLEDTGAKVSFIQAKLGHESLATTGRYLAALKADENPHGDDLAALMGLG
jgi:integrase/recombinase XerD